MKNLLLIGNIDGKSVSLLRYASRLCNDLNIKLHILRVEESSGAALISSQIYFNKLNLWVNQSDNIKRKEIEHFVQSNTKDLIDKDWISHKLMKGNVEACVDKFVNVEKIDLLIIRQVVLRNNTFIENEIFSSIFMNISDLPMLVVPENQVYESPKKIAYFTTFSETDFINTKWLSQNFPELQITLIHFTEKTENLKNDKWFNYLKSEIANKSLTLDYRGESIEDFINREAITNINTYDCLALNTHKRNFWKRIIDPSTTIKLISEVEIPVFIFKSN
jgi:hypothetical protein